jgi:hypothetical protein
MARIGNQRQPFPRHRTTTNAENQIEERWNQDNKRQLGIRHLKPVPLSLPLVAYFFSIAAVFVLLHFALAPRLLTRVSPTSSFPARISLFSAESGEQASRSRQVPKAPERDKSRIKTTTGCPLCYRLVAFIQPSVIPFIIVSRPEVCSPRTRRIRDIIRSGMRNKVSKEHG